MNARDLNKRNFECGKQGHRINECPVKKKRDAVKGKVKKVEEEAKSEDTPDKEEVEEEAEEVEYKEEEEDFTNGTSRCHTPPRPVFTDNKEYFM